MMRYLLFLLALIAAPALASTFSVSGWTAQAGQPARFVIARATGTDPGYVSFRTDNGTATSRIDFSPWAGRVYFKRGQASRTISTATFINSTKLGQTLSFRGTISVNGVVQSTATAFIVEPPVPAPVPPPAQTPPPPAPVPAPMPMPAPAPVPPANTGYVLAPSLAGLDPGATPFNIYDALIPGQPIPGSAAPDYVGAFRFIMFDAGTNSDDAVVGLCGNSHRHQYYGRKGWNCSSTYEGMRASSNQPGNDFNGQLAVNGSGYWMPAMLDANGNVVKPRFVGGYYKRRPASDPHCGGLGTVFGAEGKCIPVPNGIRMIGGYNVVKATLDDPGAQWFNCQSPDPSNPIPGAVPGHYANLAIALANCPVGALVGAIIEMPDCWDGNNLDTPDHRAHMAHQKYDGQTGQPSCDAAHPYVIPKLTLGAWYPVAVGAHFSCDMNLTPGTCFHADYFENWDPTVKAMWENGCINKMLNCSAGDLGNGYKIKGAAI